MGLIGDMLKQARERKGLTLKQIEDETNMRWKYLEALENEEYDVIPGETYVKGFLRNYSAFLGLDCDHLLEMYKEMQDEKERSVAREQRDSERRHKKEHKGDDKPKVWVFAIAGLAVVVLAGYLLSGLISTVPPDSKKVEQTDKNGEIAKEQQPKDKKPIGAQPKPQTPVPNQRPEPNIPVPQPTTPNATGQVKVDFTAAIQQSWVLIRVDGIEVYEGFINPGQSKSFAGKQIFARVGNAGAVNVALNGKPMGVLGAKGEVKEVNYP